MVDSVEKIIIPARRAALSIGALLLVLFHGVAAREGERWVTDQLEVDMRRGQGNRFAITRMVPSGTAVALLETDAAGGYSRVRTPSGAEGWLLSRYLSSDRPARLRLPETESRLSDLRQLFDAQSTQLRDTTRERDELQRQVAALEASGSGLEKQLAEIRAMASGTVEIAEQNRLLTQRASAAEKTASELGARNRELADQGRQSWFIAGAGVLGGGFVLGIVLPRIRWKRKSGWNRL